VAERRVLRVEDAVVAGPGVPAACCRRQPRWSWAPHVSHLPYLPYLPYLPQTSCVPGVTGVGFSRETALFRAGLGTCRGRFARKAKF
jgi:hypothetical protein